MNKITNLVWEVGPLISKRTFKNGENLVSPVLRTHNGESWWLNFYPSGDEDNADNLVFWLYRDTAEKKVQMSFEIHFCFSTAPVRVYNLQHTFEIGEDVHKWVIDDVKNFSQLKIFIPPSDLCFIGYLKVCNKKDACETSKLQEMEKS